MSGAFSELGFGRFLLRTFIMWAVIVAPIFVTRNSDAATYGFMIYVLILMLTVDMAMPETGRPPPVSRLRFIGLGVNLLSSAIMIAMVLFFVLAILMFPDTDTVHDLGGGVFVTALVALLLFGSFIIWRNPMSLLGPDSIDRRTARQKLKGLEVRPGLLMAVLASSIGFAIIVPFLTTVPNFVEESTTFDPAGESAAYVAVAMTWKKTVFLWALSIGMLFAAGRALIAAELPAAINNLHDGADYPEPPRKAVQITYGLAMLVALSLLVYVWVWIDNLVTLNRMGG